MEAGPGWGRWGAVGFGSGNILWCLIPSANLLSVLGTLKVMWGLLLPLPCPTRTGCGANLPWNLNFDP